MIGRNPVAVLATLLLMSYAKIIKTCIEVYSFAKLDYPENVTLLVWLKDGNVSFLDPAITALFNYSDFTGPCLPVLPLHSPSPTKLQALSLY
jgi:hypothetical protein